MSHDSTPSETSENRTDNQSAVASTVSRQAVLTLVLLCLFSVQPAAAQTNAICSADNLPSMIEGFFQLTTGLGIVGLAVVWQADSLIEMFTLNLDMTVGTDNGGTSVEQDLALDASESGEVTLEVDHSELGTSLAELNLNSQDDDLTSVSLRR